MWISYSFHLEIIWLVKSCLDPRKVILGDKLESVLYFGVFDQANE